LPGMSEKSAVHLTGGVRIWVIVVGISRLVWPSASYNSSEESTVQWVKSVRSVFHHPKICSVGEVKSSPKSRRKPVGGSMADSSARSSGWKLTFKHLFLMLGMDSRPSEIPFPSESVRRVVGSLCFFEMNIPYFSNNPEFRLNIIHLTYDSMNIIYYLNSICNHNHNFYILYYLAY